MADNEYSAYHDIAVAELAGEEVKAFGLSLAEATRRSVAAFERLVPNKILSASNQRICVIESDEGDIGVIWYELRSENRDAYIYDLQVWPSYRRRGYASQALRELEKQLGNLQIKRILLNVFSHNEIARLVYNRLGFEVRSHLLIKLM